MVSKRKTPTTRRIIHVTYSADNNRWKTLDVSYKKSKLLRSSRSKGVAMRYARRQAKSSRRLGQVVIHGMDGKIQKEWTYGADPVKTKG